MNWEILIVGVLGTAFRLGTPLLLGALGEVFAERSGVLNLGIEGTMAVSAFTSLATAYLSGNLWLGVLVGMVTGILMGLSMAYISVTVGVNQIVSGLLITLLGSGISIYLNQEMFGGIAATVSGFKSIYIPVLSEIPVLGPILFQHNFLVYLAILLTFLLGILLYRTHFGLKVRSVGENPEAAETAGINVHRIQYLCVMFGGLMAGLAGTYLTLGHLKMFTENMVAGRGYMSLVIVIFAAWNPYKTILGALLFGGAFGLTLQLMVSGIVIPYQFLFMLPYLITIISLIISYKRARPPAALAVPYKSKAG